VNLGIRHRDLIQCIGFKTSICAAACATIFFKYRKESLFVETQLKPVGAARADRIAAGLRRGNSRSHGAASAAGGECRADGAQ
jgi:hypothetical protein